MSSDSPKSSSSNSPSSSKRKFRPCPKCPHRLSDLSNHEPTPETEIDAEGMKTDKTIAEEHKAVDGEMKDLEKVAANSDACSIEALAGSSPLSSNVSDKEDKDAVESKPSSLPYRSRTSPQVCPENCTCPNLVSSTSQHAKAPEAKSWLDTKEGQDHIKICIPSCEYKKLQAERDGVVRKGEELLKQHLSICVKSCPLRSENGGSGIWGAVKRKDGDSGEVGASEPSAAGSRKEGDERKDEGGSGSIAPEENDATATLTHDQWSAATWGGRS